VSQPILDVGHLPRYAFGHRSVVWWATMGMIAIEATMFALVITSYLYLKGRAPHWPPGVEPPQLLWGTLNTAVMLLSLIPNQLTKNAAERLDLRRARLWMVVAIGFALIFNVIRIQEFRGLNVWFDENAYGSIVWALLGFHTTHILTDLLDSIVLAVLLFTGPLEEKRFVDVSENCLYWYFVVASWLPIYAVLYLAPRFA
jgi:heme/copper-type cytochrome/quinol oxidase subunit 3